MIFKSNFRFPFRRLSSIPQLISTDCCHRSRMPMLPPSRSSVRSDYAAACLPAPRFLMSVSLQLSASWQTGLDQLEAAPCARSLRYKSRRDMRFARTAVIEQAWRAS